MSIQFAGGAIVNTTFVPTNKATLQSNVVTQLTNAGWSQSSGPSGGGSYTVTITIASPGVVTLASHGLLANDQVVFSTTGALPTGLTAGTVYYVKTVVSSSTFTVSSSAGGTVINTSGSQSGTQSVVGHVRMLSASTPWSISMIINIADNGGTCLTFSIEDGASVTSASNSTTGGGQLNPGTGSTTYNIIADKYQAFIFQSVTTPARGFVAFGTPYLPTFLQSVLTQCCWLSSNGFNDTNTTIGYSLRVLSAPNGYGNSQGITNTNLCDSLNQNNGNTPYGVLVLITTGLNILVTGQAGVAWSDASALMQEPLLAWGNNYQNGGSAGASYQQLIRGQLWDAVLICNEFVGDTTTTFDGHNWRGITDSNTTTYATLFICTT